MATPPEKNIRILPGAIVCSEQTTLIGNITIGNKTVVHPTATIIAENGPITIGDNNLIEEYSQIINHDSSVMEIGSFNIFEVGCYSEALKIGDNNILESKCNVGKNTVITSGCIIGAMCSIDTDETLPENTVIYGRECKRRIQHEKPTPQAFQLDFLSKIMPNYQKLEKPNFRPPTQVESP
ncbi:Dynactin subunit 6 [Halotydeus destructor]|nr:Dynactin subunit 6 [Halotydeus destructor]